LPITPFLYGLTFDPETERVMGVAFEMARMALRLPDGFDPSAEMLAKRIIELARGGLLDPDRLCEQALNDLRSPPQA
jgi:hypothetical protein